MSEKTKNVRYALVAMLLLFCSAIQAQTVSGNVKDGTGEPIIGATVMEQGTQNGTVTDFDGNFNLTLKGKSNKLVFSYVGMQNQTVDVAGKSSVNITMKDDSQMLEEVVAIGYGTVRKKDLTGAVANMGQKQLKDIPVSSATEAMTGKMAGVNITTTEGSPDADIKIRVRGGGSLSQDNSPLYIVDGFEVASISDIAPSEIESIDVLKDASSTAIYGARGANGVIIVTTKSGTQGKVKIDVGASWGWKKATGFNKVLSPYEFAYYQYEQESSSFTSEHERFFLSNYGSYRELENWKGVAGTDYQDEIFGRTGNQCQYTVNVSGGSKKLQFNLSYAHNGENSIMLGSGYSKNNINGKLKYKPTKWVTVDFQARFAQSKVEGLSGGTDTNDNSASNSIVSNAARYNPINALSNNNDDDDEEGGSTSSRRTPLQRIQATDKVKDTYNQNYSVKVSWKPWKHWTFASQFQYTWRDTNTDQKWLSDATTGSKYTPVGTPQSLYNEADRWSWTNSNTITYDNKKLFGGRDQINVMLGEEMKSQRDRSLETIYTNYAENSFDYIANHRESGQLFSKLFVKEAKENLQSWFGRVNYTMKDKYLATFTMRADGSSKFGKNNKWGVFPSLAVAWRMSDENFLKDNKTISNLKLRLSFGTSGNNRIPSGLQYVTYTAAAAASKTPYFNETRGQMYELSSSYKVNDDLKWETTLTRNFGIDFGFFKQRLSGSLDFYWNTTKDLLMKTAIPASSGYQYQYQNFGQTSNKGIELQLNAVIIEKKDFNLNFTANISYNKNKIDKLNTEYEWQSSGWTNTNIATDDYHVVEGAALGEIWGYKLNGCYTTWTPENKSGDLRWIGGAWLPVVNKETGETAPATSTSVDQSKELFGGTLYPGMPKVEQEVTVTRDENGNETVTYANKKQKLGNTIAPWSGGFGFNGTWKSFDFNIFFNYSLGNQIINGNKIYLSYFVESKPGYNLNEDMAHDKRYTWVDPATGLNLGRPNSVTTDYYSGTTRSGVYYPSLEERLAELNSGRTLYNPAAAKDMYLTDYAVENASFLRLQQLTVGYTLPKALTKKFYCQSMRVYFTAMNLFCLTSYSGNDPEVDTSSKKNAMCPGVDYASYPKSRTYTVGVNLSF